MNNWQEWVVGVLIVLCIARVIYGIYLFFLYTALLTFLLHHIL